MYYLKIHTAQKKQQQHNHSLSFISQAFFPEGQGASLYKYIYLLHSSLCIKTFRDIKIFYPKKFTLGL